jgi:zinc transport system substrate-binding protein
MTATRSFTLALLLAAAALPFGCSKGDDGWPDRPGPKVVASFPPVASIALAVAGGDAVVRPVMTTQSPHDADPKPADLRVVRRADLFLINGLGLDDRLTERVASTAGRDVKVVKLGDAIPPKELLEADHDHGHEGHAHHHGETDTDPHVWLGLGHAKTFAAKTAAELAALDPAHAAGYEQRAAAFAATMDKLKADGTATLKDKKDRKFLPFHGSMAYFAESFGLTMVDPIQTVPGQEPSPKKLDEIVKACLDERVRVIAVEPQFSAQSSAKRILDELHRRGVPDAVMVELDPLETCPAAELNAEWYEAKMRANVAALAGALK